MLLTPPIPETARDPWAWEGALTDTIQQNLRRIRPIHLEDMTHARLMKRTDTKYVFLSALLPQILSDLALDYDVLEVGGVRMQRYRTCYYDTPDFQLYHQHHNDQRDRYKLRIRSYLESTLDFLEVKRKDNHDRTLKNRLRSDRFRVQLRDGSHPADEPGPIGFPGVDKFLETHFPYYEADLVPKLSNRFYRIALVSRREKERLTIDLDLRFMTHGAQFSLPGLAVAEVKQPHFTTRSAFIHQMRRAGRRPTGFSKYCVGVALAYPQLKRNAFKPLLLDLRRLVLGGTL